MKVFSCPSSIVTKLLHEYILIILILVSLTIPTYAWGDEINKGKFTDDIISIFRNFIITLNVLFDDPTRFIFLASSLLILIVAQRITAKIVNNLFAYLDGTLTSKENHKGTLLELSKQINNLRSDVALLQEKNEISISDTERDQIRNLILQNVSSQISNIDVMENISRVFEEEYSEKYINNEHIKCIRSISRLIQDRLTAEIYSLGRRANINLFIGMFLAFAGLLVLTYLIYTTVIDQNIERIQVDLFRFAIRISLPISMQIFSYFFLRLYRYGIFEIKYFQNEITSAQLRIIALETVLMKGDSKSIEKISIEMAKTERNIVLKKGETTIAMHRDEIEKDYDKQIADLVPTLLKALKSEQEKLK